MKVKVLVKFKDKYTKIIHKKDKILDVTEERFAEILEVGPLVEKVEEPEEVEKVDEEPDGEPVEPEKVEEPEVKSTKAKKSTKK